MFEIDLNGQGLNHMPNLTEVGRQLLTIMYCLYTVTDHKQATCSFCCLSANYPVILIMTDKKIF